MADDFSLTQHLTAQLQDSTYRSERRRRVIEAAYEALQSGIRVDQLADGVSQLVSERDAAQTEARALAHLSASGDTLAAIASLQTQLDECRAEATRSATTIERLRSTQTSLQAANTRLEDLNSELNDQLAPIFRRSGAVDRGVSARRPSR